MDLIKAGGDANNSIHGSNQNNSCLKTEPKRNRETESIIRVRDESI